MANSLCAASGGSGLQVTCPFLGVGGPAYNKWGLACIHTLDPLPLHRTSTSSTLFTQVPEALGGPALRGGLTEKIPEKQVTFRKL